MNELTYVGLVQGPEYGADDHCAYRVTFTRELLERIAHLARQLARLKVFSMGFLDSSPEVYGKWPVGMPDAILHGDCEPEEPDPGNPFDPAKHRVHADFAKITIYSKGDFAWSWYPKYGGRNERCDTEMFNLAVVLKDWKKRAGPRLARAA